MSFQTGAEIVANMRRMSALMQQRRPGRAGVAAMTDLRELRESDDCSGEWRVGEGRASAPGLGTSGLVAGCR